MYFYVFTYCEWDETIINIITQEKMRWMTMVLAP